MTKRIVFLSVLIMFLQFLLMMCLSPYVDQKTFVLLLPRFLLLVMKILSSYKSDEFYFNICNYLDNPKHPIPHPQIDKFTSTVSFYLTIKFISHLIAVHSSSRFVMALKLQDTLVLRKLPLSYLAISGGLLSVMMLLIIFILVKHVLVQSLLVISLMDSINLLTLLIVLSHLFQWIILRISLHLMVSFKFLL